MIFYVNLTYNTIADPTSTGSAYFATGEVGFLSPGSTQYVAAMRAAEGGGSFSSSLSIGVNGLTTGPTPPQDVTIHILHEVAGQNRVATLDPTTNNFLGQSAALYGVGVGGDGTAYTQGSPLAVAVGKVISHRRVGKLRDELIIRPHSDAHRVTVPSGKLHGYPNGLRFDGNSAQAEITGYTSVPAEFTLGAAVLLQRAWDVGASDTQTIMGTRSARLYFSKGTNEYARQLHFDYEISGPSTVTVDGPTFDADESVKFITARVDTSPATGDIEVVFGVDQAFTTATGSGGALSATAEAWKLGRFRTSTTDSADTIIGAWFLFDTLIDGTTLIGYISRRLTGDEDNLVWYFPGESAAGSLLDYASANADSPLDATITTATAAPLFLGTADLAGVVMPSGIGFIKNAPLTAIDPARKIYRGFFDPVSTVAAVQDRQVPYTIEATYESPLDLADTPPTVSGNVTVCPWLGGLVRVHTEVDGVENTADVAGHSIWSPWGVYLQSSGSDSITFPSAVNTLFESDFAFELFVDLPASVGSSAYKTFFRSTSVDIAARDLANGQIETQTRVYVNDGGFVNIQFFGANVIHSVGSSPSFRLEAENRGGGGANARLVVDGTFVDSDSNTSSGFSLGRVTPGTVTLGYSGSASSLTGFPMRLWDSYSASDTAAETAQREYLFSNPSASASGLTGMWYRYDTSRTTVIDETSAGNDGTATSGVTWNGGVAATDRLSAAKYLLDKSSTSITFGDTAFDYDPTAISYHIPGGQTSGDSAQRTGTTVAQAAASALSGGGLYLLLHPDGTATIGQVQDPATATPLATERIEFVQGLDEASYEFQPSVIETLYGPNPVVQKSVLAAADADRKSFAERPNRSLDVPVGENRSLYSDDAAPDGRRWIVDTKFVDRQPANAEGTRVAAQWDSPRPIRTFYIQGRDSSQTDAGYTAYQPGDVLKIQHERLPGGEVTVILLSTVKSSTADMFTGR